MPKLNSWLVDRRGFQGGGSVKSGRLDDNAPHPPSQMKDREMEQLARHKSLGVGAQNWLWEARAESSSYFRRNTAFCVWKGVPVDLSSKDPEQNQMWLICESGDPSGSVMSWGLLEVNKINTSTGS